MRLKQIYIFIAMIATGLAVQAVLASPATAALYISQGIAASTNLLSGSSASSITNFHYNIATLPATSSVRIQFSKDNATWYSSGGTPGGWDTLALGQADLSLTAFVANSSWTNGDPFYYKLEINSTADLSATPTIDDIRLDYTPASGYENVFVFDNFGNVGIGTTSPSGKLDIHGAGTGTGVNTQWSDLTGAAKVSILDNGNVGIGTTLPSQLFQVNNSGSTAFVITSGGNVGIGITSPGAKLEINNANNWGAPATSGAIQTYGTFRTRTGGGVLDVGALANGSTWLQVGEATALGTNYHLLLQPNGGNVGIGTTAPTNLLDVAGGVKIGAGYAGIGTTAPLNGLLVQGNVGIGTTRPNAKLTITSNTAIPAVSDSATVLQIVGGAAANSRLENFAYGGYSVFAGRRADGTVAIPSAVQANEIISRLDARGYGATSYSSAPRAMIDLIAGENWTDSAQGGYLSFSTTLNGGTVTSEKVRIDNAGNVGIGTTNPLAALEIGGSGNLRIGGLTASVGVYTDANKQLTSTPPATGVIGYWSKTGTNLSPAISGDDIYLPATSLLGVAYDPATFSAGTVAAFNGNVGIGTASPGSLLTIKSDSPIFEINRTTSGSGIAVLKFADTAVRGYLGVSYSDGTGIVSGGTANSLVLRGEGADVFISNGVTPTAVFSTGGGVGIGYVNPGTATLAVNGNVGIGTTNPGAKLQVYQSSGITLGDPATYALRVTQAGSYDLTFGNDASYAYIQSFGGRPLQINNAGNNVILNPTSGNVGIGTTSPKSKLAVSGGIGIGTTAPGSLYLSTKAPDGGLIVEGSVGIGTTAPGQELDVNGQIRYVDAVGDNLTYVCKNSAGDLANCVSLEKYKNDITDLGVGLNVVNQLRPVKFKWDSSGKFDLGFIAEEVQKISPLLAIYDEKGNLSGVKYPQLTALLTRAVQEQQTQISDVILKTSQNVETVGQLQKSVDVNLTVISSNFSAVDTKLALHDSELASSSAEEAGQNAKIADISTRLTSLDTRTSAIVSQVESQSQSLALGEADSRTLGARVADLQNRLTAAENSLIENEHDLITFEKGTNDTLSSMLDTEDMLTNRVLDHEDRIKALEAKIATMTVSTDGAAAVIPANVITQDASGNASLAGIFTAKGIVAGSADINNLKLGAQTSGSAKILSGQTEIVIPSTEVKVDSKIYITPAGSTEGKILYVKKEEGDIIPGESFKVKFDGAALNADVEFNWLIVN